ncbi:hypothetical protein Q4577_18420 [Marinovum sp. 2_MG-2023]|uniref:hypothetical protein n=1 Tax=unclassified Marinovum TaxID=2647166 RepID=UPI0026E217AB|nr:MULTISPECIES: hypothetical protein [unclassified Marinovum]MDO6732011.1 hypothetical protein [Marinovum sp. 2_MG-2023]MDO6781263.1 hypothetical protein [Marinovum sp. 1_MG-2023]
MKSLSPAERTALNQIERLEDPEKLRNLIANARRVGSVAIERAAFQRLCLVQPEATPGTVEHDVWQTIHALEEMLKDDRGKTVRLNRTRQKIARDGEAKTVSDLTLKPEVSTGFTNLIERGHPALTFEAVVLRHPKTFDGTIQAAARTRLENAQADVQQLIQEVPEG